MASIAVVAGETSGDIHAGNLVAELKKLLPELKVWAVGGPNLARAGAEIVFECSRIAAMGIAEAAAKLPELARARKTILQRFRAEPPDLFIPVDFGGFNLKIAAEAKKLGIPVIYYIPPKAWAWGHRRVAKVRDCAESVIPILPFEHDFWMGHKVKSDYVGSPVRDFLKTRRFESESDTIALLPGSRVGEVTRIWPKLAEAAHLIAGRRKARFLVARSEGLPKGMPDQSLLAGLDFEVVEGDSQAVMERAALALVASGTATLECALLGTPMVVVYRMNPVTLAIARRAVKVDVIALPNLIAGQIIVPELIQTPADVIAAEALRVMEEPGAMEKMKAGLAEVGEKIGPSGASARAAALVLARLGGKAAP